MKQMKYLLCLLAVILAANSLHAQGLGFYLGGKRVELTEGDSINFTDNKQGEVEVKVTKEGNVEVYKGEEMTFFGDLERYLLDLPNSIHYMSDPDQHYNFGYGGIMHIRDILTADMYRPDDGYNWFSSWAENKYGSPLHASTRSVWRFYENAITAVNKLIGAIDESKANDQLKEYLGVGYAFRAMYYLDMARMYEYLPCDATQPYSYTGKNLTHLTVPIITEKTTPAQLAQLTRASREEMKAFINSDLAKAEKYLANYKRSSKLLPDLACVYGLQARLNMWIEDYTTAADMAGKAITQSGSTPLSEAEMLNTENGFNNTAPSSWMWGAQPHEDDAVVLTGIVNWGSWMCNENQMGYAPLVPACITPSLFKEICAGDPRSKLFLTSDDHSEPHLVGSVVEQLPKYASLKFRPYKGSINDVITMAQAAYPLMRVEEMYLIQAEAIAHSSAVNGLKMLNTFMQKYRTANYNYPTQGVQKEVAINEIVKQKRIELWGEGQSFFDYKRLNMSVDRTQGEDAQYIPANQQLSNAGNGRPAWMNLVFPQRNLMQYAWNSIGQENPDPSDCYWVGGGMWADHSSTYDVTFNDGIVRELFGIKTPAKYVTLTAEPLTTAEGLIIKNPFSQIADSTMGYTGSSLVIRFQGTEAYIPEQKLGFRIDGNDVMVQSTANATLQDGVITFPRNSITVTYGSQLKVVNSLTLTELRIPGSNPPAYALTTTFYADAQCPASVINANGKKYLRTYLYIMRELDEVRLACVPDSLAETALARLEADAGYGTAAKDTGWVQIPMPDDAGKFTVVGVGTHHGSIIVSKTERTFMYPDYSCIVTDGQAVQDKNGNWNVQTMYYFGPHTEKGYVALVDKYATTADIKAMFEAKTLPAYVAVRINPNNQMRVVTIPYPKRSAEYKLACLSVAGNKVVNVGLWSQDGKTPEIYECPVRNLSVALTDNTATEDGGTRCTVRYDASEFDGAYIALLPDSMLQGNIWTNVLNSPLRIKVSGSGSASLAIPREQQELNYTLVIAGCDADGKIQKDVKGDRVLNLSSALKWYNTKAEWLADGHKADEWPLSESGSTCSYKFNAIFKGTQENIPIYYRKSPTSNRGQFQLGGWAGGTGLIIDYNPDEGMFNCRIHKQFVTMLNESKSFYVADLKTFHESDSYNQYPCHYDRSTGVFTLYLCYFTGKNEYTQGKEEAVVDGFGNSVKAESTPEGQAEPHRSWKPSLNISAHKLMPAHATGAKNLKQVFSTEE